MFIRKILPTLALGLGLGLGAGVQAAEILTNGGFETGNFSGWTVAPNPGSGGCDQPWQVAPSGSQCFPVGAPIGSFGAYTALDGAAPGNRTVSQAFNLSSVGSATLQWSEAAQWSMFGGALNRLFSIDLRDSGNSILANIFTQSFNGSGGFGLTAHSVDVTSLLAAYTGQNLNLAFTTYVPQNFTGPAGFLLDGISLEVTAGVPEPGSLALLGLGLAGLGFARRQRKAA